MSITSTISNIFPKSTGVETEYTLTISGTVNGETVNVVLTPADGRYQALFNSNGLNNVSFVSSGADEVIPFKSSLITPDSVLTGTTIAVDVTSTSVNPPTFNITVRDRVALALHVNGTTIVLPSPGSYTDSNELMGVLGTQEYYLPPDAIFSSITDKNTYTLANPAINPNLILVEVNNVIVNNSLTNVKLCTSRISDLSYGFSNLDDDTIFPDMPSLDTSNVTNMYHAFDTFTAILGTTFYYFNVSSVVNMEGAFSFADVFDADLSQWIVTSVTNMSYMFQYSNIRLSLAAWNTSSVTNMSYMFNYASQYNISINGWNVSSVTNMSYMFANSVYNQALNSWNVSNVTDMSGMFKSSPFGQTLSSWVTTSVTNMSRMFMSTGYNLSLSTFDTSNVTNMSWMFASSSFNQSINNWDVSSVTTMENMFSVNNVYNQPMNLWVTTSLVNVSGMFTEAGSFNQDISSWNVSNVTDFSNMFRCVINVSTYNQPLNTWNTSSATTLGGMFNGAVVFNQPLNNWDISKVVNISDLFNGATNFNQNINTWNTSKVNFAVRTFLNATSFDQPLNLWNTKALYIITSIFEGASNFNQDISSWQVCNVYLANSAFKNASTFDQDLSSWTPNIGSLPTDFATGAGFDGLTAKYPQWGAPCAYFNAYTNLPNTSHVYLPATNFNISQYFVDNGFPSDLTGIIFTLSDPNYTYNVGFVEPNIGATPGSSEFLTVNYNANGGDYSFGLTANYPDSDLLSIDNTQVQNIDLSVYTPGGYTSETYSVYSGTLPAGATLAPSTGNLNVPANGNFSGGDNFILQIDDGGSAAQTFVSLDWVYSTPLTIPTAFTTYDVYNPYDLQGYLTGVLPSGVTFGDLVIAAAPTNDPLASYSLGDLTFAPKTSGGTSIAYTTTVTLGDTPSNFFISVTYNDLVLTTELYTIDKSVGDTIDPTTNLPGALSYASFALEAPVTDWAVNPSTGVLTISPGGALTGNTGTDLATTPEGFVVKVPLDVTYATILIIADDNMTYIPGLTYDLEAYVTFELAANNPGVNYGDVVLTTSSGLNLTDKQNVPIPPSTVGVPVSYPIDATYLGDTTTFNLIVAYPQYLAPALVETVNKTTIDTIDPNPSLPSILTYASYTISGTPPTGWAINPTTGVITISPGAPFTGSGTANVIATTPEGFEVNLPINYTNVANLTIPDTSTTYNPTVPFDLQAYFIGVIPFGISLGNFTISPTPTDDPLATYSAGNLTFPPKPSYTVVPYLITVTLGASVSTFTIDVTYDITTIPAETYNINKSVGGIIDPTINMPSTITYDSSNLLASITDWTTDTPTVGQITIAPGGILTGSGSEIFIAYASGYQVQVLINYEYAAPGASLTIPPTAVETDAYGDPSEVVNYINEQLTLAGTGLTIDDFTVTINGDPYEPGYTLPENPGGTLFDLEIVMSGPYNVTFSMQVYYPFDLEIPYLSIIANVGTHKITTGEPKVTATIIKERVIETLKSMLRIKLGFKYLFGQVDNLTYPFFDPVEDTIVAPDMLLDYFKQGIVIYNDLKVIDKFIHEMFPLLANFFKHLYKFYDGVNGLEMDLIKTEYGFRIII